MILGVKNCLKSESGKNLLSEIETEYPTDGH